MQFKYAALLFAALASFIGATASAVPPEQTGAVASSILRTLTVWPPSCRPGRLDRVCRSRLHLLLTVNASASCRRVWTAMAHSLLEVVCIEAFQVAVKDAGRCGQLYPVVLFEVRS
ncbi:hypothetical protein POSPLADRAFT_1032960 [Postia placenta MAD-698-R-SB12]|uniref:Uncharacterized protein n=1 Tax=Postia placenta MAD-698-R-SB12 TaxID=670580 RepID=A0A1X6N428_9APHY|nr:hypothetical protein POSPLADRAFT_1032960 [Postia placenta MAD-698-R-SB12]OSX63280.1 hypothetical protein POSPLADRAFT_1032960 [Postia placenta MAD-698-R-SB12]